MAVSALQNSSGTTTGCLLLVVYVEVGVIGNIDSTHGTRMEC